MESPSHSPIVRTTEISKIMVETTRNKRESEQAAVHPVSSSKQAWLWYVFY
jgi:hypothetical protein